MYCMKCPMTRCSGGAPGCAECNAAPAVMARRTDFSISGLMSPARSPAPPPPPHHAHLLATTDAYLLSAYFLKLGYYQPAGPLIKEGREDAGPVAGAYSVGGGGGAPAGAPPPYPPPAPQPYHAPQPQPQLVHAGYGVGVGVGVGQYFPADLCFSRYYGRPTAYPPPPPPQPQPPTQQDQQILSPYYPPHCYHQSPPHRPMPYIPEVFRGASGGPPCPCPMRTCPKNVITGPAVGASGPAEDAAAVRPKASPAPALAPLAPPLRVRPHGASAAVKREPSPQREVSFSPKKAGIAPDAVLADADAAVAAPTPPSLDAPADLKKPKLELPSDPQLSPLPLRLTMPTPIPPTIAIIEPNSLRQEQIPQPSLTQRQSPLQLDCKPVPEISSIAESPLPPISTIPVTANSTPIISASSPLQTALPSNGIGEHVKIKKRQKVTDKQKDKSKGESIKTPTKRVPKLTEKIKTIVKKKKTTDSKPKLNVRNIVSNSKKVSEISKKEMSFISEDKSIFNNVSEVPKTEEKLNNNVSALQKNGLLPIKNGINANKHITEIKGIAVPPLVVTPAESVKKVSAKRKNGLSDTVVEPAPKKKKLTEVTERNPDLKLVVARPKNKSALLLDKLIKKNSIDRVIENVVKEAAVERREGTPAPTARRKSGEGKRRKSSEKASIAPPVGLPTEITKKGRRNAKAVVPKWSNGWSWQGESYEAKVYINSTGTWSWRTCWQSMYHAGGAAGVRKGDAVLLRATSRGAAPFVARVAHLWRDLDGEMMLSLVWYYRPEHTERGRQPDDAPDEVFASRHRDSNSVACIDDKCYVLTYNEYCRYRKLVRAAEQGITIGRSIVPPVPRAVPHPSNCSRYPRPLPPLDISPDRVLFCRKVYDYRLKKIIKNPPC